MSTFLSQLARRILVFDGAMGTQIHKVPLSIERDYCGCENCTDILAASRPDVIQRIHEEYLAAGADVVETDSFGASRHVLAEFGIADRCYEIARASAEVARAACAKFTTPDTPRFVAGSIGPGTKLVTLGNITWDAMLDSYREQARGLIDGGIDVFIIETCQDLLQVKCVVNAVLAALAEKGKTPHDIPIMVSVTIESTGTMLLGTAIEAAAVALASYPIISLGLNCATGPTEMTEHIHWLGKHWARGTGILPVGPGGTGVPPVSRDGATLVPRYLSVMPNAGLPVLVEGRTEYPLRPEPFVEAMTKFVVNDGVRIVGGCCGTTPEHIRLLAQRVEQIQKGSTTEAQRHRDGEVCGEPARTLGSAGLTPSTPSSLCLSASVVKSSLPAGLTSLYSVTDYRQDASFLIVGERMNASGSKKFKQLLETDDWDNIVSLAKEQLREGAHILDLNVDYAGRDNARDMVEIVKRVVRQVDVPLMLDSTQMRTIEAGLKHAPGKCIINSANFEDGEEKFDVVMKLARTYGAAVVIGAIDEDKQASMARTADRKLAIAARAFERATTKHGLAPDDILFDPLVLPISTGMESDRRSALELVDGVRRISAAFPRAQTVVGLSNVSFGLAPAARLVLNSALLHELREAGLTAAIVHAGKILPENKIPEDQWAAAIELIYDRRESGDPLARFIDLFKDAAATTTTVKQSLADLPVEERLRRHIIDGEKQGLKGALELALQTYTPLAIINDHLLDGMKTVGELFGSGRMQLPFVLQSAEVMKMAVSHLEPLMERVGGSSKGTIVLATVKGDVHDIGKNLVDIILSNNGYTVVNLGIKQPLPNILQAWREHKADAIGLSGLLVKSVNVMEDNIREMNDEGLAPPLLLGGAALTRHYCEGHLRSIYQGSCFYGKDAFEGLRTMDHLMSGAAATLDTEIESRLNKRTAAEDEINQTRIAKIAAMNREPITASTSSFSSSSSSPVPSGGGGRVREAGGGAADRAQSPAAIGIRSSVSATAPIPASPFLGTRAINSIDLDEIYPFINPIALFRGQWGFKKGTLSETEYDAMLEDKVLPIFDSLKQRCRDEKLLQPRVVYGYFPCNAEGDDLVIWDSPESSVLSPESVKRTASALRTQHSELSTLRELARISFPRQADKRRLCIADFFRPIESGQIDIIGMHCVTMGPRVTEAARALFAANDYTNYLYLHGMGVECAEALAELWHKRIRQELGIAGEDSPRIKDLFTQHYRGSRYSFGYPACPALSDHEQLFRLLKPERIGCTLTENWQIDPEQSTSAIIVHHPEAKYFNV